MPKILAVIVRAAAVAAVLALACAATLTQPALAQQEKTKTERLLGEELNEFAVDENGWTHLHWAAAANDAESVRRLLEMGATPNITDNSDESDFSDKGKQRFKLLGKEKRWWDNDGQTPLLVAVQFDSRMVATILIANGANVNAKDKSGDAPLHYAMRWRILNVAARLIENGADVNAKDYHGNTPLHEAASNQLLFLAALLIENGADVNAKDYHGNTPLHIAAYDKYDNHRDFAALLIENGADVNAKDNDGETPLHSAANTLARDFAALLIENGADINAKSNDGRTPMDVTIITNNFRERLGRNVTTHPGANVQSLHANMQSLLRSHGGRCNISC